MLVVNRVCLVIVARAKGTQTHTQEARNPTVASADAQKHRKHVSVTQQDTAQQCVRRLGNHHSDEPQPLEGQIQILAKWKYVFK